MAKPVRPSDYPKIRFSGAWQSMNLHRWQLRGILVGVALAGAGVAPASASQANQDQAPANQPAQPDNNAPAARARFQSVPITTPQYATSIYGPGFAPWNQYGYWNNNALSGAADVINSQGQLMVSQQQAYQMREQYFQMKIQTRRMNFDEYLYERALRPTEEDERERHRLEDLRRSRNNPPTTEILSGTALNRLLLGIQQQQAQGVRAPDVPIDDEVLKHINFTAGQTSASIGLIKDGGTIQWPDALQRPEFDGPRKQLDKLAAEAFRQLGSGPVDAATRRAMNEATDSLASQLKGDVQEISSADYIQAKRYLSELENTVKALANADAARWTARGRSVASLTQDMSRNGVKFAAASPGDEAAYNAMHTSLVAYYMWPDQAHRWDVVAK
jgi:hypothetical protein